MLGAAAIVLALSCGGSDRKADERDEAPVVGAVAAEPTEDLIRLFYDIGNERNWSEMNVETASVVRSGPFEFWVIMLDRSERSRGRGMTNLMLRLRLHAADRSLHSGQALVGYDRGLRLVQVEGAVLDPGDDSVAGVVRLEPWKGADDPVELEFKQVPVQRFDRPEAFIGFGESPGPNYAMREWMHDLLFQPDRPQTVLIDRSVECVAEFESRPESARESPYHLDGVPIERNDLSRNGRWKLVNVASAWARDNGYLPCDEARCLCMLRRVDGTYAAHIHSCDSTNAGVAELSIELGQSRVVDAIRWQPPCQ